MIVLIGFALLITGLIKSYDVLIITSGLYMIAGVLNAFVYKYFKG